MALDVGQLNPTIRSPKVDREGVVSLGAIAAEWMHDNLVYGPGDLQGKRFEVDAFQEAFLEDLYKVDLRTGKRIVRRAVLGVAKGNAKSELEAAIDLFELYGDCVLGRIGDEWVSMRRPTADIPVAAASYEQADLVFGAARVMCEPLGDKLDVFDKVISRRDGTGKMYRVAAVAGTNDGLRPTSVSIDELHEWQGNKERVYLVLTNGLAKRQDSFELSVSTAGDPHRSDLLHNLYEYGKKVASGEVVDESFLIHWYEAEADCDLTDHDALRESIRQANPGSWVDVGRIAQRWEVDRIPEAEFRRYYLNQWVTAGDAWLPAGVWNDCEQPTPVPDGTKIVAGFDGSYNGDSTALIGCTLEGHLFELGVWEKPETARDWKVPRSEVDAAVDDLFSRFDVVELACDPARWTLYLDEWVERYGNDRVIEFTQTRAMMAPATAKFYDAAVAGLLSHDGSATLARHVANATVKPIPGGQYLLQKDHPDRKIDAAVAAVMAFARATWRRENDTSEVRVELW